MTQKTSRWLAYMIMAGMACSLVAFIFPFPAAITRGFILACCLWAIFKNLKYGLTIFDKACLCFMALSLVYYYFGILQRDFELNNIINTSIIFLAFPAFSCLARRGAVNERFILISSVLLCVCCVFYYFNQQAEIFRRNNLGEDAQMTINASVALLMLMPMIFLVRNKIISFAIYCICIFFIISAVKRGNIIAAIIPSILYIRILLIENRKSAWKLLLFTTLIIMAGMWVSDLIINNEFLQQRYQSTLEGNSSHRDVIYQVKWDLWYNGATDWQKFFGYGFEGTRFHGSDRHYAHNDWLEILVDYGLLGIIAYVFVFATFIKMFLRTRGIEGRSVMLSILSIWFIKTCVSMAFQDDKMALFSIPYGAVIAWYMPRYSKIGVQ